MAKNAPKKNAAQKAVEAAQKQVETENEEFKVEKPSFDGEWDIGQWERASFEIWKPEEGEFVIGIYDGNIEFAGDFEEPCLAHHIIDRDGNRISFVPGMMADKFITEAKINKGDMIFAQYTGQGQTNKGQRVNNWDIRFKRTSK
jgi:hypothetical protein